MADFKVSVGPIARTLLYEDAEGTIRFTFDVETISGKNTVFLDRPGRVLIAAEQRRIDQALTRTRDYLLSRGYEVELANESP